MRAAVRTAARAATRPTARVASRSAVRAAAATRAAPRTAAGVGRSNPGVRSGGGSRIGVEKARECVGQRRVPVDGYFVQLNSRGHYTSA